MWAHYRFGGKPLGTSHVSKAVKMPWFTDYRRSSWECSAALLLSACPGQHLQIVFGAVHTYESVSRELCGLTVRVLAYEWIAQTEFSRHLFLLFLFWVVNLRLKDFKVSLKASPAEQPSRFKPLIFLLCIPSQQLYRTLRKLWNTNLWKITGYMLKNSETENYEYNVCLLVIH